MGLLDRLERGELGVRWHLNDAQILEHSERSARLVLPAHQVTLEIVHAPRHLDECDLTEWRAAIEREARQLFEESFHTEGPRDVPRTHDPTWSPLIEFEALEIGAEAWWILLRRTYAPGDELAEGQLLLPIARGLLTLSLRVRERVTGYRESALALQHQLPSTNVSWPQSTQAFFDSPEHDSEFPEHCLSRVRRARQWLLDPKGGALAYTEPAIPASGAVVLEEPARRAGGETRPSARSLGHPFVRRIKHSPH